MSLSDRTEAGLAQQHTSPLEIAYGGMVLDGVLTAGVTESEHFQNPDGVTVIGCNGHGMAAEDLRFFAAGLQAEGRAQGLEVATLAYDDRLYFNQAAFTGAVTAGVRYVRRRAVESHRLWLAAFSRGTISAVQAADGLEPGMIQGVMTVAGPAGRMRQTDGLGVLPWFMLEHGTAMHSASYRSVYEAVTARVDRRKRQYPDQSAAERDEVVNTDIADAYAALSRRPDLTTVAAYYKQDIIVPADTHIRRLRAAGFGGAVLRLNGTHFTPFVDTATPRMLVRAIRDKRLPAAAA